MTIISAGALVLTDYPEGVTAVLVIQRIVWIEPDRLIIVLHGAIVHALAPIRIALIVEGGRIFRIQPNRLVVIANCQGLVLSLVEVGVEVPLRLVLIGESPAKKRRSIPRRNLDGTVVVLDGAI